MKFADAAEYPKQVVRGPKEDNKERTDRETTGRGIVPGEDATGVPQGEGTMGI